MIDAAGGVPCPRATLEGGGGGGGGGSVLGLDALLRHTMHEGLMAALHAAPPEAAAAAAAAEASDAARAIAC